jgi:hypothetical protein
MKDKIALRPDLHPRFEEFGITSAELKAFLAGTLDNWRSSKVLQAWTSIKENGGPAKAGRVSSALTVEERKRLIDAIGEDGRLFCATHKLTDVTLGSALMGKPVALVTAAQLRTLLGAV